MTKDCSLCKINKPLDEFHKAKNSKSGRYSCCKICRNKKYREEYYHAPYNDYENTKRQRGRRKIANVTRIMEYLNEHPCVDCGYSNVLALDFDHLRDKTKDVATLVAHNAAWSTIEAEMKKCVVRCANCHRIKTALERNSIKVQLMNE